ncbi:MAG: hypothetical protein QMD22_06195 [archaeon]|nr:hypothetical protein [archaeon]
MLDNGDICEEIGTSDKFGVISDRIGIRDRNGSNKAGISDRDIFDKTGIFDTTDTGVSECLRGSLNSLEMRYKANAYPL